MTTKADRIRGAFLGGAVGDAMGMPVESMSHTEILNVFGLAGIRGYHQPYQTRIPDTAHLPAGTTTDDTYYMAGVADSLVRCRGFDLYDQARELVMRTRRATCGCGPTTRRAALEIGNFLDGTAGPSRSPHIMAPPPQRDGEGCGNGVAIKIAPLAIWHYARLQPTVMEPFDNDVVQLGTMTHGDPRASFAAAALGGAIAGLINLPCDHEIPASSIRFAVLRMAHMFALKAEERWCYLRNRTMSPLNVSERLNTASLLLDKPAQLRKDIGTGFCAMESVPFAIATYLRNPYDARTAIREAVNAGGDTDSVASMVGVLCGTTVGLSGLPPDLLDGLLGSDEVLARANRMIAALGLEN